MKRYLLFLIFLPVQIWSQSSQDIIKEKDSYVFGQIYADFHYSFKNDYKPQAAFDFNQGIIGYYHKLSPKVSGKIMFDVTRTTRVNGILDSAGQSLSMLDYFEGSKYTAYLKMAEIRWDFHPNFTFRFGQLLNTQYLTFQDPFWGYRYIDVTFQEKFRFGMPADFGAQLDFHYKDKFLNQLSIVNGEGPFRYQDMNGKFVYSDNIQYSPIEALTLKFYIDYGPAPDTAASSGPKSALSFFAGYKVDKFRVGAEYDYVSNYNWMKDEEHSGFSIFAAWKLCSKFDLLARWDHLIIDKPSEKNSYDYILAGVQYEPEKKFTTSINFRYLSDGQLPFVYASFGLKF